MIPGWTTLRYMAYDLSRLHHVGLVVVDMADALARYRRLGFKLDAPVYPAVARKPGRQPEPFGAANTHADLQDNFVELATVVPSDGAHPLPDGAQVVPLAVPAAALSTVVDRITADADTLAACLDRFEGLHILVFEAADIDAVAERWTTSGVPHGEISAVRRPVSTPDGVKSELVRYLGIDPDDPDARPGAVAEGRIGVAARPDAEFLAARERRHPNGARRLVEAVLCVADADLPATQGRYEKYLGRLARPDGPAHVFDLDDARLTLLPASALDDVLPGEQAPALPALVAYAVAVDDLDSTRNYLSANGFPLHDAPSGDVFVPARAALGAAVIFRATT